MGLTVAIAVLGITSVLLLGFGINLLFLTWSATRLHPRPHPPATRGDEQRVCVQIPVFDERYVAERVIDAVCEIEWPRARFEVQVLDDSDDDTVDIVARRVQRWKRRGVAITHVRRGTRAGFKAGALAHGLTETSAPFIAIFDADFVPPADFLRRTMGVFDDARVGFAQARWGHLDENYSWFTRLQALAIDFHFLVEQAVRSARGYFTNFTGTAGVWRRAAIEDAGGWSAATLTEDLDLSYRAQLRGWRAAYLEDLVVPEELPVSIDSYRRQQSRWATGSFQAAFTLLIAVLRSDNRGAVKLQAAIHLLAYSVGPLMLLQLLCYPWLLVANVYGMPWQLAAASIWINLIGVSPWVGFMVAQTRRGRRWWSGAASLLCQVIGAGMSFTVICAFARATRSGGVFERTPKYRIVRRGQEWRDQAYVRLGDPRVLGEAVLGLGAMALVPFALMSGRGVIALYSGVFALGFLALTTLTLVELIEVFALRNLGRRALARLHSAAPAGVLIAGAAILLLAAAQLPMPFEDGYAHWLIAANLAATGHLHDPLFGMEDTWLPGYQLLGAAVLRVFGLWSIDALRLAGVAAAIATLVLVYRLAANRRQGLLAVALLALNPVFLFASSETVAEPMTTSLLSGAALAAVRSRWKIAAVAAALACATSTKAWLFVGVAVTLALVPSLASRGRARVGALAGAKTLAPAAVALALIPFGIPTVFNSLARGAQEVLSAVARGSLPADGTSRAAELVATFGLAALPLFAIGAVGFWLALRTRGPMLAFVYAPAAIYLGAVVALVGSGSYTGSHRYLYPALPALALLAASALDRQPAVVRLLTAAAAGMLALAFLPVFTGFANSNAGLVAAGRAAAGSPGMLVTDSPAVAFYSHKTPGEIIGSQALPLDRDAAIAWIRAHGVTEMVVENISYYRATLVFPELSTGSPTPPFMPLGDQRYYQAPGGKTVFAYRLGAALDQQVIYPGVDGAIRPAPAGGKSAPLAKGVTLLVGGVNIAGEGMGFGVPIVHYADGWVYPRTVSVLDMSSGTQAIWKCMFQLDEIGGDAPHDYSFVPIASRGSIEVTYTVAAGGVTVVVRPISLAPGYSQVAILNEESAAFDNAADPTATHLGADFGRWMPMSGGWARLRAGSLGVEWSVPALSGAQLYAGRELSLPGFDWAGLDYVFDGVFTGAAYQIHVQQAR